MPVIEGSRVVLAVLELTDSTIHLLKAASHREISTKQLINALRWLVARERQTIRRQSKTIQGLQEKLEDMEMQLEVAQRQVQQRNQRSRGCGEGFKREEYVVDEKIQLPSLADLERFDMIPKYCVCRAQSEVTSLLLTRIAGRGITDCKSNTHVAAHGGTTALLHQDDGAV